MIMSQTPSLVVEVLHAILPQTSSLAIHVSGGSVPGWVMPMLSGVIPVVSGLLAWYVAKKSSEAVTNTELSKCVTEVHKIHRAQLLEMRHKDYASLLKAMLSLIQTGVSIDPQTQSTLDAFQEAMNKFSTYVFGRLAILSDASVAVLVNEFFDGIVPLVADLAGGTRISTDHSRWAELRSRLEALGKNLLTAIRKDLDIAAIDKNTLDLVYDRARKMATNAASQDDSTAK